MIDWVSGQGNARSRRPPPLPVASWWGGIRFWTLQLILDHLGGRNLNEVKQVHAHPNMRWARGREGGSNCDVNAGVADCGVLVTWGESLRVCAGHWKRGGGGR